MINKLIDKHSVVYIAAIMASVFLLSGCGNKMNGGKRLSFDSVKLNRTEHLFGDSAKPYCNLIINIAYPIRCNQKVLKDTLTRSILTLCLGSEYAGQQPEAAIGNYVNKYLSDYRRELEPSYKMEKDTSALGWYNYYRSVVGRVKYQQKNLLTYELDYNEYTGGAHNIYATSFENYDLKKMRTIKLTDLFKPNYQNELTSIIIDQLMKDKGAKTVGDLLQKGYGATDSISPTENFYFDKDGMIFFYNVYEITPYYLGTTAVHVDFRRLKNIMILSEFQLLGLI